MKLKKSLGQHLLIDPSILNHMQSQLPDLSRFDTVLEIGPGRGALTAYILELHPQNFKVIELDDQFVDQLKEKFPELEGKIIHKDVLKLSLSDHCRHPSAIVGNFPYNISSGILFKVYEHRDLVQFMMGMFQKEVAKRIAAGPGSKSYGILSVLLQAFYKVTYLFDVPSQAFKPPPKVESGVIKMERNGIMHLNCNEILFKKVVKLIFQQRRKMIRNSLKSMLGRHSDGFESAYLTKRPEQLTVDDFITLTKQIEAVIGNE